MRSDHTSKAWTRGEAIREAIWIAAAALPMGPALWVNWQSAASQGQTWLFVAIFQVVFAALFLEASLRVKSFAAKGLFLWAMLFCLVANVQNALTMASHSSDDQRGDRTAKIASSADREEQKKRLHHRREEQVRVAGEDAAATIQAEIDRTISADPLRWKHTGSGCKPELITREDSKRFCTSIAILRGKLAAAEARDRIEDELRVLAADKAPAVTSIDPYTDSVAAILAALQVEVTKELRGLIASSKDLIRAIMIELLAAAGPSAILALSQPAAPARPASTSKQRTRARPAHTAAKADPKAGVLAFADQRLEVRGSVMTASGAIWQAWEAYRQQHGLPEATKQSFGRVMGSLFEKRDSGGRPRYLVAIKTDLRVVSSN